MERVKRILNKLLFPGIAVVLISVPIGAVLLTYTFLYASDNSPIAYVSYVVSAYSLIIVCACFTKFPKERLKKALHRNQYVHRYLTDVPFKTHVSLYLSLGINLLFAATNLFSGVRYRSVWFGTLAVYYSMLGVMRFLLLRHVNRNGIGMDIRSELKRYRMCGVILLLMNSALSGVVILVLRKNEGFHYAGYLIYVAAMYAFYSIITAVRDVVKYRKYNSPVMSAAKVIKLAAAMVSMLALETAMLAQFDEGKGPRFRQLMTGTTGGGVCVIVLAMAAFMIVHATKQLKSLKDDRAGVSETEELG